MESKMISNGFAKWFEDHPEALKCKSKVQLKKSAKAVPKTEEEQIKVRGHPYSWIYCGNCGEPSHGCTCDNPNYS